MPAWPKGSFSSSACASAGSVIFTSASKGMILGLASGVALAVQLPMANTFVVRAAAAVISAEPVKCCYLTLSSIPLLDQLNPWGTNAHAAL
jgi:hypothetical protein